jgi:hypothetical protein
MICLRNRTIGIVVDQVETVFIVDGRQVSLSNTKTDSICETLAKGASGNLNTVRMADFGMSGSKRTELAEALQVIHRQLEAEKVQKNVL